MYLATDESTNAATNIHADDNAGAIHNENGRINETRAISGNKLITARGPGMVKDACVKVITGRSVDY